ncbi:MAG: HAD-IA family hydrolase [Bacteroidia bacterium]|nr:HAD-IA family hydrolase [Bacteroidia bacterium]
MAGKEYLDIRTVRPEKYSGILFDLGGVIYDIDLSRAYAAFQALPREAGRELPPMSALFADPLLLQLELGTISNADFLQQAASHFGFLASPQDIENAWMEVLEGVVPVSRQVISGLAGKFRLNLLSNSNTIHHKRFFPQCESVFSHFENLFFSFDFGLAKPGKEIFLKAAEVADLDPAQTLFIDDSRPNLAGAVQAGFDALLWPERKEAQEWWKILDLWKGN